jgi:hypothetical protein
MCVPNCVLSRRLSNEEAQVQADLLGPRKNEYYVPSNKFWQGLVCIFRYIYVLFLYNEYLQFFDWLSNCMLSKKFSV